MAASASHFSLLLFGIFLLAELLALVRAEPPQEGIETESLHLSSLANKDDADYKVQKRGLFDMLGLSSLRGSGGNDGTRDSFNNFGPGEQNFSGAVINSGGKTGGTSRCFNNMGSGEQNFSGAVINSGSKTGGTSGSFNNMGSGKQSFGAGTVFNTGARIGDTSSNTGGWGFMNLFGAGSGNSGTHNSFNNRGPGSKNLTGAKLNTGKTSDSFNSSGGGTINLSGATINSGAGSGDQSYDVVNSFNGLNFSGNMGAKTITWMGKAIEINTNGLTLRGLNSGSEVVSMRNNQIFVGDKLVSEDINKLTENPSYQKSADGARWYGNVQIGEPMSKAEIDKFETDWAQHIKEREEKDKQREQRTVQRLQRQAEEREKRFKKKAEVSERRAKQGSLGTKWWFW